MSESCEQLEPTLTAAARGDFDALSPEQIAALEAHVDQCESCASRLAGSVPQVDPALTPGVPLPTNERWAEVWTAIDAAGGTAQQHMSRRVRRPLLRLWGPLVAAAACVLVAVIWELAPSSPASGLDVQLSTHVEVDSIETFGDVTSLVDYGSGDSGSTVIWLLEDKGAQG